MIRSRIRVFFVLAALLLAMPAIASIGFRAAMAQEATPVAQEEAVPAPLAEAMPAGVPLFLASEFDPESEQYIQLAGLTAQLLIPGAGDTIAGIAETLARLLARLPSDTRTVLEGEAGIALTSHWRTNLLDALRGRTVVASDVAAQLGTDAVIVLHPIEAGKARELMESWFTDQLAQLGQTPEESQDGATRVLRNPEPPTSGSFGSPNVVVFAGDYIFLGNRYDDLPPFVAAAKGEIDSLAGAPQFQQLNTLLPTGRLLSGYIDSGVLHDVLTTLQPDSNLAASIDPPFGETLFAVAAEDAGLRFESVSGPIGSGGTAADAPASNPDFASRVPGSTMALVTGQDLGQSWAITQVQKLLLTYLASAMGAGDLDLSETDADTQFGVLSMLTGINFKTDMLDLLEGNYGAALFSLDPEDPLASSAVVASELADSDRVSVAMTSLGPLFQSAGSGTASVTTQSVDGQTVNSVAISIDGVNASVQYGVVDDQLMVGLGDGVSTLASPPATSLANSSEFQTAMSELPSTYGGLLYLDVESIASAVGPKIFGVIGSRTDNPIVECISGDSDVGAETQSNLMGSAMCSVLGGIFGGSEGLQDLIVARVPGPLAAVGYQQDNVQHVSGILMIGSND